MIVSFCKGDKNDSKGDKEQKMLIKDLIEKLQKMNPEKGVILVSEGMMSAAKEIEEDADHIRIVG
ncbi:MAG: hypothetical protein ACRC8M_10820 [Cetobacterium sp.]|uniref:hypothetical protein n=1 Tax=Cetobacterium sp. TaxID=2071632 RepID=UPI003F3673CB